LNKIVEERSIKIELLWRDLDELGIELETLGVNFPLRREIDRFLIWRVVDWDLGPVAGINIGVYVISIQGEAASQD